MEQIRDGSPKRTSAANSVMNSAEKMAAMAGKVNSEVCSKLARYFHQVPSACKECIEEPMASFPEYFAELQRSIETTVSFLENIRSVIQRSEL